MSWVTKRRPNKAPKLVEALQEAAEHCLVFCSTADTGQRANDLWIDKALESSIFRVSASDTLYNPRNQSLRQVDVMVNGEDITADGPRYIKRDPNGVVSGSSVATALAAGIASLSLCLIRIMGSDEARDQKLRKKNIMLRIFEKMRNGQDAVIDPAKMFQHGFKIDAKKPGPPPGLRKFECKRFIGI